jgi:LacI family transcriptional regulator
MKKGTTIVDIAKVLNVTASTVSRALHDHPSISIETKKQVLKAAKKLKYHPNSFATSLRKGRGNTIGLVVPQINRNFFSNVIHGVEAIANQYGYNVLICQSQEKFDQEKEVIKTLINSRVDGIIISVSKETKSEHHIKSAIERGIPVVQFDRTIKALDSHQVLNDNFAGAYDVIAHLASQDIGGLPILGDPNISTSTMTDFLAILKQ